MVNTPCTQAFFPWLFMCILLTPAWALETNSLPLGQGDPDNQRILVELPTHIFFMTHDGVATYVDSGKYKVALAQGDIRLTPVHGGEDEFIVVKARQRVSNQPVNFSEARLREASVEQPDLLSVVLVSVDGHLYEAIGSKTGVWPRK